MDNQGSERKEIRLGKKELEIMKVVWRLGRATVHDVKEVLGSGRKPAYSTILTMMRKLEIKGYLTHEVAARTYIYSPAISKGSVTQSLLQDLLDRLFDGSPSLLVNSLLALGEVSDSELDEIRKLLEREKDS